MVTPPSPEFCYKLITFNSSITNSSITNLLSYYHVVQQPCATTLWCSSVQQEDWKEGSGSFL